MLNIQPQLPAGASVPTVSDDFGDVFGIYYGLVGDDGFSYEEMRNWAERIKTQVITADGVMKVALFGTQTEVVNIYISVNKLAGMGIDPKQVASLLQSQNQIINTGEINAGEQQLRIVANGTYTTVNDIRNQVITTPGGQVKLGDIAVIEKGYMDPPGNIMHVNGKRAIGIGVSTDPTKDVVKTGELVDQKLAELLPLIPVGLELESLYPENVIAQEANNGFIINLIESLLIVIVIIMLVMGLRAGILIGSSLIFTIGGTLLIMSFIGVGLNRTSLAGFIIAMGMLVDNAIVVTDNAQIAIARGIDRRKALIDGATYMFAGLEKRKPDCFAVKQYKKYKLASGKTAKSILISCGARLAPFDIPQLREVMAYDELELDRIGDRKTAVFFIISDTTQTYNFLVALAFSQMFNLLCERADNVHGGRLPHHVRVLWDEAANTGQVPQLEKLVAVIRSREVSLCLLYQQLAQCKAIYDKHAETILGNMDSVVFLGGREASTIKEISENWLGKATISMQTDSRSRGQSESYSQNTQRLGRELMTPAELATMPGDKCILQLRGLPPFFSPKYDLKRHPNYRYTAEADKQKNAFDLDRLINRRRRPGLNEACTMYEVTVPDDALTEEDEDILNYDDIDDPDAFA